MMSDAPAYLCAAISICESGLNIAYHMRYPDAQVVLPVCLGNIEIENLCEELIKNLPSSNKKKIAYIKQKKIMDNIRNKKKELDTMKENITHIPIYQQYLKNK